MQILAEAGPTAENNSLGKYKPLLYVALVLALGLFLLIRTRRRVVRSQRAKELSVSERVERHLPGKDIYSQINQLMAALADLSRQINGQIDTRLAKLQIIMRQAEQTIAKLEKLTGNTITSDSDKELDQSSKFDKTISDISDEYHRRALAGQTESAANANVPSQPDVHEKNSVDVNKIYDNNSNNSLFIKQTLSLAAQGRSAVDIAKELNRPIGEIELVLALQAKKDRSD